MSPKAILNLTSAAVSMRGCIRLATAEIIKRPG
jgi:hypothetical protein